MLDILSNNIADLFILLPATLLVLFLIKSNKKYTFALWVFEGWILTDESINILRGKTSVMSLLIMLIFLIGIPLLLMLKKKNFIYIILFGAMFILNLINCVYLDSGVIYLLLSSLVYIAPIIISFMIIFVDKWKNLKKYKFLDWFKFTFALYCLFIIILGLIGFLTSVGTAYRYLGIIKLLYPCILSLLGMIHIDDKLEIVEKKVTHEVKEIKVTKGTKYCTMCGTPANGAQFCTKCGNKIR